MKKAIFIFIIVIVLFSGIFFIFYLSSCRGIGCSEVSTYGPGPYIAKTRNDYSKYVWINMSLDKETIISHSSPTDIKSHTDFNKLVLHDGYFINSFAWGSNDVPIDVTIADYSKMKEDLSIEQMKNLILDKYPYVELYDCGKRYAGDFYQARTDPSLMDSFIIEINKYIDGDSLEKICDKLL